MVEDAHTTVGQQNIIWVGKTRSGGRYYPSLEMQLRFFHVLNLWFAPLGWQIAYSYFYDAWIKCIDLKVVSMSTNTS